jgi:hypothetical protein
MLFIKVGSAIDDKTVRKLWLEAKVALHSCAQHHRLAEWEVGVSLQYTTRPVRAPEAEGACGAFPISGYGPGLRRLPLTGCP